MATCCRRKVMFYYYRLYFFRTQLKTDNNVMPLSDSVFDWWLDLLIRPIKITRILNVGASFQNVFKQCVTQSRLH